MPTKAVVVTVKFISAGLLLGDKLTFLLGKSGGRQILKTCVAAYSTIARVVTLHSIGCLCD
jgi:membrane protein DedA with SNARE-associated domain